MSTVGAPPPTPHGPPPGPPPAYTPGGPPPAYGGGNQRPGGGPTPPPSDFGHKPPDQKDFIGADGKWDEHEIKAFDSANRAHTAEVRAESQNYAAYTRAESKFHETDRKAEVEHHRISNDNKMSKTFGK